MLTCPCNVDPLTPNFYSEIEVYRGIKYFLSFALKHRLRVQVIIVSKKRCIHNLCFEKNKKCFFFVFFFFFFYLKVIIFAAYKIAAYSTGMFT